MRARTFVALAGAALLVAAVALWLRPSAGFGWDRVLRGLAGGFGVEDAASPIDVAVLFELRLPRILTAIFAGASLAVAGTVMQAVFRNPLASPDVMGTQAGAALGAVIAIALGIASEWALAAPAGAFLGAGLVSAIVFVAAAGPGGVTVTGVLLAGMALNSLVGAATAFVVSVFHHGDFTRSGELLQWLMGGLENSTLQAAAIVGGGLLVFGSATLPFWRDLDVLTLEDDSAASLGIDIVRLRIVLLVLACGVTATAVSSTGGIAFVGLVVPHMARLLVGPAHRALIPSAAVGGALILLLADCVVQWFGVEVNLRIGVVTATLGAPFFLYLLARHRRGYAL